MEGEFIAISVISGIFFLVGLLIHQKFWERKYKFNFDFERFKIKENKKAARDKMQFKIKNPAPNMLNDVIAKYGPDVINNFLDQYQPEEATGDPLQDLIRGGIEAFANMPKRKDVTPEKKENPMLYETG